MSFVGKEDLDAHMKALHTQVMAGSTSSIPLHLDALNTHEAEQSESIPQLLKYCHSPEELIAHGYAPKQFYSIPNIGKVSHISSYLHI